ncbi:LacI family DNA-binding transcriptional regulator [Niameybacter massiliensis]|uniref:LacI family DNA-binding transcriptional regulator n=1 Tax=Niameybacter massiliensis TaxID=1658108 RepID=UPI0006B59B61|nr:LacI family DNA-binding transcriptional regulator [Niameybacter massiliensis]
MEEITIKTIAEKAGVSISTVSRVMNNTGSISDKTKQRVMQVIKEYNYMPNTSARNLKSGSSKNIALFVRSIENPFFQKMIHVIEEKIALRGYQLIIQNVTGIEDELEIAIREAKDRNLCGAIIMGGTFNHSKIEFERLGIPCVLVTIAANSEVDLGMYSSVTIDDEKEAFKATEYLIKLGHKRIGFINNKPLDIITPNSLRYNGYVKALQEYNIPLDEDLVASEYSTLSGYNYGFNMMKQLIMRNKDMTAVFAFADVVAVGAAKAIFSMGLSVPNDISVVGFDGIDVAEFYNPSIDTIYQPADQMALSSIETLFDMIQGGESKHLVYDAVLLKRGSCRAI